jgi:hypothetical protein
MSTLVRMACRKGFRCEIGCGFSGETNDDLSLSVGWCPLTLIAVALSLDHYDDHVVRLRMTRVLHAVLDTISLAFNNCSSNLVLVLL